MKDADMRRPIDFTPQRYKKEVRFHTRVISQRCLFLRLVRILIVMDAAQFDAADCDLAAMMDDIIDHLKQ